MSGGYVLGADNLDASNPFNDFGIEGKADNDVGGVGVLGYGQQAKSYGVYGVSFGSNGIGVYGAGDGPTPSSSATPDSTMQSTGVAGDSHSGSGVYGSTEFPNDSDESNPAAGVIGSDDSGAGNYGVAGLTTAGESGVLGYNSGDQEGVIGESNAGIGSYGISGNGGMAGISFGDVPISDSTDTFDDNGVLGETFCTTYPCAGGSFSGSFISLMAQSVAVPSGASYTDTYSIVATDSQGNNPFYVDDNDNITLDGPATVGSTIEVGDDATMDSNLYVSGNLYVHGTTGTYAKTRNSAQTVQTYSSQASRPTVEDFGRAALSGGQAYVRLEPTYAQSIDDRTVYMVFLTPEGDTKGLYVTGQSMNGFTVRENQGGRSNVSFSYRIVASQYGANGRRMAIVVPPAAKAKHTPPNARAIKRGSGRTSVARLDFQQFLRKGQPRSVRFYRPRPNFTVEHRRP